MIKAGLSVPRLVMLHDEIVHQLKKDFPATEITFNNPPLPSAVFPASQEDIGRVLVHVDGNEVIVDIEKVTHGHFASYDESLSEQERSQIVTEMVSDFLQALFTDRVLLYYDTDGRVGGYMRLDLINDIGELSPSCRYFLWSKPFDPS